MKHNLTQEDLLSFLKVLEHLCSISPKDNTAIVTARIEEHMGTIEISATTDKKLIILEQQHNPELSGCFGVLEQNEIFVFSVPKMREQGVLDCAFKDLHHAFDNFEKGVGSKL